LKTPKNTQPPKVPITLKPYTKPAKTPEDLLVHLEARGLLVNGRDAALKTLRSVGYYRLLIYMRALQSQPSKAFAPGTSFENIVALYDFDRELRLLCLDAIERIEVALRTSIINSLSVPHGPHFYLDPRHFETPESFRGFFGKAAQANYLAISHYHKHYNSPPHAPIWAICEAVTFGSLSHLFSGLNLANRKLVAKLFGFDEEILVSWFRTLNDLRNMCAHHNRLWNAHLIVNKPRAAKAVSSELRTTLDRFYSRVILIVALLKKIDQTSDWRQRFLDLLSRYPNVQASEMGFPDDWKTRPFWS
jgi:abortive infection bacteriophage resistance protein